MTTITRESYANSTLFERIFRDPVWYAFAGSLFLSAISIYGTELPNRDGMLYIQTASIFIEKGLAAARANFDWVFFPACIAFVAKITGLGLESAAYTLNSLLFAGVCATAVRIVQVQFPSAAWYACLVVLSFPSFNEQRNELIREIGWWFFCLQALLAALRWQQRPNYRDGLVIQCLLAIACLFRVEAVVFFGSLALWQFLAPFSWRRRLMHLTMLLSFPLAAGVIALGTLGSGQFEIGSRIATYAAAANPAVSLAKFQAVADKFGAMILSNYSADEAGSILFFGLVATVIKKFITHNGIFLIPIAVFLWDRTSRRRLAEWQPQAQFFFVYTAVLVAFVIYNLFMSGRYVIFLNILTMPLIAIGVRQTFDLRPRWRPALLAMLAAMALANVVSFSPKKTQFREAGQWLASRPEIASTTYIEDSRTRYCAGPAFWTPRTTEMSRDRIAGAIKEGKINYLVVDVPSRRMATQEWARSLATEEVARFSNKAGDAVVVFKRRISP